MRVERAAHVELDAECLLARDQAPAGHEDRAGEADQQDRRDDQLQRVPVVPFERACEPGSGQERGRELRRLREDGEDDRDPERPLVRPQEREQADERSPVRHRRLDLGIH